MEPQHNFDEKTIVMCFQYLHDPSSTSDQRKQANTFIIECQKNLVPLIKVLVSIFQNQNGNYVLVLLSENANVRLQALIYLSNVIKRNWNNKALLKRQSQLPQIKKHLPVEILKFLQQGQKIFVNTLFDITKFIAKSDYPHVFTELTDFVLMMISSIQPQPTQQYVKYFKQVRDIFLQLADKKGFPSLKSYEEGPLKILFALCPISEFFRQQLSKVQQLNPQTIKISKYVDQIMLSLLRMAPYSYLDNQNFMMIIKHIHQKTQTFLSAHANQNNRNKTLLQKDLRSIIYQSGCLQVTNPFMVAPILADYISTLFYIISKPQLFVNPPIIKYSLLSMKKLVKQFTYFSNDAIFSKSVSSQQKSANSIQLRNIAHAAYMESLTEDTIEGLFNFLLINIMSIKSKQDQSFSFGFDQNEGSTIGYEKSMEKDLSVHVCGTILVQALIQRFNQKMLSLIYSLIKSCIQSNWTNIENPIIANFLSVVAILPKSCKRNQMNQLSKFPIISILQYVHGTSYMKIRTKFPVLICGWLDIFTNQQIGQLIQVLVTYVTDGAQSDNLEIALYSCYSINKILNFRGATVDSGYILHKIFPVSIKILGQSDNPQILWPLINLISTLLAKCEFDTNIIINSIQTQSLNQLISNKSPMLIQALSEMFKHFLCIIPRNKPATGIFKLVYHFLNNHLSQTQAEYHEKCVQLWYYTIRQFSYAQDCAQQYRDLFQIHFKRCALIKKPIIIYIMEQYLLLGLIQQNFDFITKLINNFYIEGGYSQFKDDISSDHPEYRSRMAELQDAFTLKIAVLSFYITLLSKYDIQRINCQIILQYVLNDLGETKDNPNLASNVKSTLNTLRNSYISVINRCILLNQNYFFFFLQNKQISFQAFYTHFLTNSIYLTSRGATRINALSLTSLLSNVDDHIKNASKEQYWQIITKMLQLIITQIETHLKLLTGQEGPNAGKIQNSPNYRFSQAILSQRKDQVRKKGAYDQIDIQQYFFSQFKQFLDKTGNSINQIATIMQQIDSGKDWGLRLIQICK